MESTLNALGGLLLNAVPTFLLVIFLHFYLKAVFFKPLEKVLQERHEATEGLRKKAHESLTKAEAKTRQYEESLNQARDEMYKEQEELRKKWKAENDALLAEASQKAKAAVQEARETLAGEVQAARQSLQADSSVMAAKIADSILERRVA